MRISDWSSDVFSSDLLSPVTAKYFFQNQLAAEVRQNQHCVTGQRPADRNAAAPAVTHAAPQQGAEDQPGGNRQDGLVCQMLGEPVMDEPQPRDQRQRQQHEAEDRKSTRLKSSH